MNNRMDFAVARVLAPLMGAAERVIARKQAEDAAAEKARRQRLIEEFHRALERKAAREARRNRPIARLRRWIKMVAVELKAWWRSFTEPAPAVPAYVR